MATTRMMAACVAFLALALTAGARELQQAPAPAPEAGLPVADLLFVLSAEKATFPTETTLELTGVTSTVQHYGKGAVAGLISTPAFTNTTAGARYMAADGEWLNSPDAALFTTAQNDSSQAVLLQLSAPVYNADTKSVTFTVKALPAEESALQTSRGVTNRLVREHMNGVGTPLAGNIQAGATWTDVALFIDENRESLRPIAETKYWGWGGWGGCCGGGWGGGWGGGYNHGWGGGYSHGWGGGWGR